jgi:hypothetical protein
LKVGQGAFFNKTMRQINIGYTDTDSDTGIGIAKM